MKPIIHILNHEMKCSTAGKSLLLSPCFFIIVILTASIGVSQFNIKTDTTSITILWIALALSALLSVKIIFQTDYEDGTLDWLLLSPISLETIIVLKATTHWVTTCLPMMALTPIVCIPLGISTNSSMFPVYPFILAPKAIFS